MAENPTMMFAPGNLPFRFVSAADLLLRRTDINSSCKLVMIRLTQIEDKDNNFSVTVPWLSSATGLHPDTVRYSVLALAEAGLITWQDSGQKDEFDKRIEVRVGKVLWHG